MNEHGKLTWNGLSFPKYKSPIEVEIIPPDMFTQAIIEQTENGIMAKVRYALRVDVNKEELIKALDYDRNQYEKGYKDALEDMGVTLTRCAECVHSYEDIGGRICSYGVCVDCDVPDNFFCKYGEPKDAHDEQPIS